MEEHRARTAKDKMNEIIVESDSDAAASRAAEIFVDVAAAAITERGRFSASLSGGSTPKRLYRLLSSEQNRDRIDWERMTFFIGDERNVPPDDERSNFRMIRRSLVAPLGRNYLDIRPWPIGSGDPGHVALAYENELAAAFAVNNIPGNPVFDLFLLGLGGDRHTASLFPGTDALYETRRLAVANSVPQLDELRFTMTFPVINASRNIVFLVTGEDKAAAVADVIGGDSDPLNRPAQAVRPVSGRLIWLLDRAAASALRQV